MPDVLIIGIAFQLASESIVTSSVGDDINVFKIAHMYWSISSPSVNAGLLWTGHKNCYYYMVKKLAI